jgi:hypothetical protein
MVNYDKRIVWNEVITHLDRKINLDNHLLLILIKATNKEH